MIRPKSLLLDVTSRCNANCLICGRRFWPKERRNLDMSWGLAEKLIRLPYIEKVCFGQYGETALWPHLVDGVRLTTKLGKYSWLTTNGQALTRELSRGLIDAELDKIIISIDSIRKDTYNKLRPGLGFNKVITNLMRFADLRGSDTFPWISINYVRSDENKNETEQEVRTFFLDHGANGVGFTPEVDVSVVSGEASGDPIECERPYEQLCIRVDGELMLCCRDCHSAVTGLGNVEDTDPLRLYNEGAYHATRTAIKTGSRYPAICRGCRAHWKSRRAPRRAE